MFGPVRPYLHWRSQVSAEQILDAVGRALRQADAPVNGLVTPTRIELHTKRKDQHLWSPQLAIDLTQSPEHGTLLKGRFSPHPNVWTMYVAITATLAFGGLFCGAFAYVQWIMGQEPWSLIGVPLSCAGVIALYFLSQLGQSLGHDQMDQLVSFLETHAQGITKYQEQDSET